MSTDQFRVALKTAERVPQRAVALGGGPIETVVRGHLAGGLPDPFNRHEFRRVARQTVQLDFLPVFPEPFFALVVEVVTRRPVEDQEDLAAGVLSDELLEIFVEGVPVEDLGESIGEVGIRERHRTEHVRRLPLAERVHARLDADPRPSLVECSVEPEAGFVFKNYDAAAGSSFFLIAGNLKRSQASCASALARASRLRGRCTEKPS